jgi:predicted nucleotidyltransferase component of viral defense system
MLTIEQIKNSFTAEEFWRSPRAALVEYVQYELLDSLFKQKHSEKLSFIGGTAVRIVYGSQRFSEDLDFDNLGLDFESFEAMLGQVAADMRLKDFTVEIRMVEKLAYHCYVKFPDILFQNKLSPLSNEKLLIRVDAMQKDKFAEPRLVALDKFGVYRKIKANPPEVILAQKIVAFFERKKGRDLFDIAYLLSLIGKPDFAYLEHLEISKTDLLGKMLDRIKEFDLGKMANDVKPFLIKPDQIARVETFPEYIRGKLGNIS